MASARSKLLNKITKIDIFSKTVSNSFNDKNNKTRIANFSTKLFKCYKCSKCFRSFSEVTMHLKLIHNALATRNSTEIPGIKVYDRELFNNGFICTICNKIFSENYLLLLHFNEHIDAAFYVCEICREGFQQRKDLQIHALHVHDKNISLPPVTHSHSRSVYQKCGHCSKYFRLFAEFEKHVSSCNSFTYACCICRVIFLTLSDLDEHRLTEHKLDHALKGYRAFKQGKRYFCGICYLGFFKGNILKKHLMTHEMEMSYICDVCHVNFTSDNDLQSHYLQHIEEHYVLHDLISQHSCSSCMKTFKTQQELKDHLIVKKCRNDNSNFFQVLLSDNVQKMETGNTYDGYAIPFAENNSDPSQDVLKSTPDTPFDVSQVPVYALKSGEELLNCDDSECVTVVDLTSLFILQLGICASENRMPDVKDSEAYNETDVIDASLLQNHMHQILSGSSLSEETSNLHNIEPSCLDQNLNTVAETVTMNFDESNDDSIKFSGLENTSLPVGECESSTINCDNTNETFEFLAYNTNVESFINVEQSSTGDIITETPCNNKDANSESINEEIPMECNDELSLAGLYICNICEQVFSSKTSLCLHVKGSHTGFDCYRCGESFNSEDELKNHEKVLHLSSFQCDLCEVSYPKEHLLKKHRRSMHGGKEFVCNFCEKRYALKNEYEIHMMLHKGETPPTKCEICGKVYSSVSNYMRHKAIHEGRTRVKKYVCNICDKAFIATIPLKVHLKTHFKKSAFSLECPKCKMYFPPKGLTDHIKSHDVAF